MHQLLHLHQAQEERQARQPFFAELVFAGVALHDLFHVAFHETPAFLQGEEHGAPDPALPGAGQVIHEPEVAGVIEVEDRDVAVVVIDGKVAVVEVVVDQAIAVRIFGERAQFGDEAVVFLPDDGQPLPVGESVVAFPGVPLWAADGLAQRLIGLRQAVHLSQHTAPILEILIDGHPLAIPVAVVGHAHPAALDEGGRDEVDPLRRDDLGQGPVSGGDRRRDAQAVFRQVVDEMQFRLNLLDGAIRAMGDAQHPRLALAFELINQVGAALVTIEPAQLTWGGSEQSSGRGQHLLLTDLDDFVACHADKAPL